MNDSSDKREHSFIGGSKGASKNRTLYPIFQRESDTGITIAGAIAAAMDAQLLIGEVETGTTTPSYETTRDVAEAVLHARKNTSGEVDVLGQTLTGANPIETIVSAATTFHINIIVMGDDASERLAAQIAERTGCDTVVVNGRSPPGSIASILVPIAGGPHSGAAVDVASSIAAATDAWIELVHILEPDNSGLNRAEAETLLEAGAARISDAIEVDTRIIDGSGVASKITEESAYHDLTVIGAPQKGKLRRLIFGSKVAEIREQAQNTVVMARKGSDPELSLLAGTITK